MRAHDIRHVRALDSTNGDVGVSVRGSESCGNRDCNYTSDRTPDIAPKGPEPIQIGVRLLPHEIFHARLPTFCASAIPHIRHFASDN